ncbi:hemolysin [Alkalispirochaeta odontotermitis]|nr:hemolysin [Alkalispirochaeta odontotermitis]
MRKFFRSRKEKKRGVLIETEELKSLDEDGKGMVRGIVELSDTSVKEVMIPRIDTVFITEDARIEESLARIIESGHSRFPVYHGTIDSVVGIIYVKDLLPSFVKGESIVISNILRPAYFVPESMKLDSLLKEMKQRKVHIAVAVDEYGGVSGIISMEDILEEIVGDIQDEFDNEDEAIVRVGENEWLCDARMNLESINDEIGSEIPTEDFDTLGGFVFDLFGKIPNEQEKTTWRDLSFIIQSVEGHKIRLVKVFRNPKAK